MTLTQNQKVGIPTSQGNVLENITSQSGLQHIIKDPIHILDNVSSCIDFIFTSQPNLITESGVHPSLYPNCHHQVVYAKFNLQIYHPPQYYREVWHYKDVNIEHIRRVIDGFNWQKTFSNKNGNEKVDTFHKKILNVLSNFRPHETIICDDRSPPWFNNKVKSLIKEKNATFKKFLCDRNNSLIKRKLNILQDRIITLTEASKQQYYRKMTNKLVNAQKISNAYWSLLKKNTSYLSVISGKPFYNRL